MRREGARARISKQRKEREVLMDATKRREKRERRKKKKEETATEGKGTEKVQK